MPKFLPLLWLLAFTLIFSIISGCTNTNSLGKLVPQSGSYSSLALLTNQGGGLGPLPSPDSAPAPNRIIMITGYWPPTNQMVQSWSNNIQLNPQGWVGRNWNNSNYDVYSYFPTFASAFDEVGTGDFPVDFAATFNDFMKFTAELHPYAIIGFGEAPSTAWTVEAQGLPYQRFESYLQSGLIPTFTNVSIQYPIPESLKNGATYTSSLPMNEIANRVNALGLSSVINQSGAGDFLCGFMTYLEGWYHSQHSNPSDPYYNAMAGFVHVPGGMSVQDATRATQVTLQTVVSALQAQ